MHADEVSGYFFYLFIFLVMAHNTTAVDLGNPGERRIVNTTCSYRRLPESATFIAVARAQESAAENRSRRKLTCLRRERCTDSCESP